MRKTKFFGKPLITLVVLVFVVAAIIYLQSQKAVRSSSANPQLQIVKEKNSKYPKAPDFVGIDRWINSEPLTMEQLRGKVVLVDFWTYTCINCIRTFPYLKEWDKKYRDKGLVMVGVHTPEFEFEKKYENVLKAVNQYQLKYAVAQDNNYATWSAYQNRYWPHKYLVDIDGYIRYDHIGEGGYEEFEKHIQELLNERMERMNQKNDISVNISKPKEAVDVNPYSIGTPEIYFGYQFSRGNFGNEEGIKPEAIVDYKMPASISSNSAYFSGKWKNNADNIELAGDEGEISLKYQAKVVNIVAGSPSGSHSFIYLDNEFVNQKNKGSDVLINGNQSTSNINEFKLYSLISSETYDTHTVNIKIKGKGFKIYTFTFG